MVTLYINQGGTCILAVNEETTWSEARDRCTDAGGNLVIAKDSRKNQKVVELSKFINIRLKIS